MEKQYINGHMTSICFFSWLSLDTGLHNMWGKSFWTILGVADFKIEITVICVLNLTVTLWLNGKKKKSLFHWWSYQTRPYISLTACFRDTRALVKGILLFILQSREFHYFNAVFQILPGSRHCFQFFFFSPLKRALTSHETRHYQTSLTSSVSGSVAREKKRSPWKVDEYHRWLQVTQ